MAEDSADHTRSDAAADSGRTQPYRPDQTLPLPEVPLPRIVQLLDEYLADLQGGGTPSREQFIAAHPELAPQLEQCLAGLEFVHRAAQPGATGLQQLGDFRIRREVGRGGMGVVYEAEQISLKRRVALKVLRFGAVADAEAMQRFQREAETVAHLHHTNIVPIFAIGSDADVHYYAMQFIEGHSLAEIGRRAADSGAAIPAAQVAQWGLHAAEALSHAHQRGVIHRDVKPSNLIVDNDGHMWLTDFGLAKRRDDVTLSVAGVLLGTPRYMSPEQASSLTRPVDHRTDIYSLGATLYELATNRPIFNASTPHGVIAQILRDEPLPPRSIRPDLPRDLETIILRCLSKDPTQRYATAEELAEDLRAFLQERPIQARRPRMLERGLRWVRKHRRSVNVAGLSVAASLLLVMSLALGQRYYEQAQMGRLALATDGPRLLAELRIGSPTAGSTTVARIPVPTPEPVAVRTGDYALRLSASGLLSETWPLRIERERGIQREVYLPDHFLWPPLQLEPYAIPQILPFDEGADIVLIKQTDPPSIRRLNGSTKDAVWAEDLVLSRENAPPGKSPDEWVRLFFADFSPLQPTIISPPPDLDGDAVPDLVVVSRSSPSLLAISGADGELLWWFRSRRMLPPDTDPATLRPLGPRGGMVVGQPAVEDVDGDGVADFVICAANAESQGWVEAVSGRTGDSLWFSAVPDGSVRFPSGSELAQSASLWSPRIAGSDDRRMVVALLGNTLVGLDADTGEPLWPPERSDQRVAGAPSVKDFDGDGRAEVLMPLVSSSDHSLRLVLRSLPTLTQLWERTYSPAEHTEVQRHGRAWHTIDDLDDDGRSEVILPTGKFRGGVEKWSGLEVLDGVTGRTLWQRTLWSGAALEPPSFERVLVGRDLDGDGSREIFTAATGWRDAVGHRLLVMALSGADGRTLWRCEEELPGGYVSSDPGQPLALWRPTSDGWPVLLVPLTAGAGGQGLTYLLSSGTGELLHTLPDARLPRIADLDGDGLGELVDTRWETAATQTVARLFAIRGQTPQTWQRLGEWRPGGDFDGDGTTDLLAFEHDSLSARAGSDGHLLWQVPSWLQTDTISCPPLPYGDLDGDGTPDILRIDVNTERIDAADGSAGRSYQTVSAVSGRNGERLWIAADLRMVGSDSGIGGGGSWTFEAPLLDWIDLDGDDRAEILVLFGSAESDVELAVLAGANGRVLWRTPVVDGGLGTDPDPYREDAADLDGDGVRDLVLWVPSSAAREGGEDPPSELRALSGRSGEVLWAAPASQIAPSAPDAAAMDLLWPRPAVGDIDVDGQAEVVAVVHSGPSGGDNCHLVVLRGDSGAAKWTWSWRGYQGVLPPLLVDFAGDGRRSVCLGVRGWTDRQESGAPRTETPQSPPRAIVILDSEGRVIERLPLRESDFTAGLGFWGHADLDGRPGEELLVYGGDHLRAYDGSRFAWTWRVPQPTGEPPYRLLPGKLLSLRRMSIGRPAEAVIWAGDRVVGLDGRTGQPSWRCDVRWSPGTGFSDPPTVELLSIAAPGNWPGVLCHWRQYQTDNWSTIVRQAWPVDGEGRYQPPAAQARIYPLLPEPSQAGLPLPWLSHRSDLGRRLVESAAIPLGLPALLAFVIPLALAWLAIRGPSWGAGMLLLGYAALSLLGPAPHALASLVALAVPVALLRRAARQKNWGTAVLASLYCLLVLAPLVGFHWMAGSPLREFDPWQRWWWWIDEAVGEPLMVSPATLPGLAFWWDAAGWIGRRHWTRLFAALGASLLVAAGLAVVMLRIHAVADPGRSLDDYSWSGWYIIGLWGTFTVGLVLLAGHLIGLSRGAIGRLAARRRETTSRSEPVVF